MPFLMSYFNIDPKPENYVHKNGIKGIAKGVYITDKKNADALKHLVWDEIPEVIEGDDTYRQKGKRELLFTVSYG